MDTSSAKKVIRNNDVILLHSPRNDSEEPVQEAADSQQGSSKPLVDEFFISPRNFITTDLSAAGVCFSVFDEEEGCIPIFYGGIHRELAEKIAFKSIVSTAGICVSVIDGEAPAIIPFPEEEVLGFVVVFSLDDEHARGASRLASLTIVDNSKNRDYLFLAFNSMQNLLSEVITQIKTQYHFGQPIPPSVVNELNELRLLPSKIRSRNKTNLADEVIGTWLGKQLTAQEYKNNLPPQFDTATQLQGGFSDLMGVLGHPVNLKLLQHFYQNPTMYDSVNAIASQFGSSPASVGLAATVLVKAGLLSEHCVGRIRVLSLNLQVSKLNKFQY